MRWPAASVTVSRMCVSALTIPLMTSFTLNQNINYFCNYVIIIRIDNYKSFCVVVCFINVRERRVFLSVSREIVAQKQYYLKVI